jgi:hypothetical protein
LSFPARIHEFLELLHPNHFYVKMTNSEDAIHFDEYPPSHARLPHSNSVSLSLLTALPLSGKLVVGEGDGLGGGVSAGELRGVGKFAGGDGSSGGVERGGSGVLGPGVGKETGPVVPGVEAGR